MKKIILIETFYILSASLAVFGLMEAFWPRVVLAYFNLNWVLILWLINAILVLLINKINQKNDEPKDI